MEILKTISSFIVPFFLFSVICYGLYKKIDIFDCFLKGAADGLLVITKIIPALLGLLAGVSMLRASGALEMLVALFSPIFVRLGIPPEILPLGILRPISGSGSLAILSDILKNYGADSVIGKSASIIMGSSETTFYAIAIYFGSVGVKNSTRTLCAALVADLTCFLLSSWIVNAF